MKTTNQATSDYSLSTYEDTPRRALDFLRGVGSTPAILRLMTRAGYTTAAHAEGQRLLANVAGFVQERQAFRTLISTTNTEAMNELSAWHKGVFRRLRATVTRFYPAQAETLFANLELSADVDATLVAKLFLERLHALEGGQTKGAGRGSHAVVKMLAERGFGPHEIKRVRALIEVSDAPPSLEPDPTAEESAAKREQRLGMLRDLRAWYDDWSETARTVLVRKDHVIRLGLARRKVRAPGGPVVVLSPSRQMPALGSGDGAPIGLLPASSQSSKAA